MSYRIQYGGIPGKTQKNTKAFGLAGVATIVLVWLLAFSWFLPEQAERFREVFFPWASSEVQSAMVDFREDVRSGISFHEAMQTFCRDLMNEVVQ